jgi:uncharacterized RDD family membrane protein YckC
MDFLPIWSNGERIYAGFWRRFWAGLIDFVIIMLVWYVSRRLCGHDKTLAIAITILFSTLFSLGYVFFNARFGGTPGKLAVAIRITKPDGTRIGWLEAWKRSSVDLLYTIVFLYFSVAVLAQLDAQQYSTFGFPERSHLDQAYHPPWFSVVNVLEHVWYWGELIVLLFNKRRRAIHDFIAGTVVIHKRFAEQAAPPDRR